MAPPKIADWNDADQALERLASLHRDLAVLEVARDATTDEAKAEFGRAGEPIVAELDRLGIALKAFVDEHSEELSGRSRKLAHGTVAYRWTSKLTIGSKRIKGAIEWLLRTRKLEYLHVEHKLNKEALREAPAPVLKAIGARVTEIDQFRYEVGDASYVVED